ncbi:MAG TPA: GTP-binding protein [Aliiroseovarius sp.]|nr:GTP-binding protein [Aliiroseovarius sp.]
MSRAPIPAIVVGGYLGAGKTTLINAFLRDPGGVRATVLVNDFGAINIDAGLIENARGDTIALTNGCACCSIGDNLLEAALAATGAAPAPDLLLVEASGVAHPGRIADTLSGVAALAPATCLSVVNGARLARNARDKFIARLFAAQIECADALSLNRFDDAASRFLRENFTRLPPTAAIGDLIAPGARPHRQGRASRTPPESTGYRSQTLTVPSPVALETLERWLRDLPAGVERLKGVVAVDTGAGVVEPRLLSFSQGSYDLTPASPKQAAISGRIIAIIRRGAEAGMAAPEGGRIGQSCQISN